MRHCSRCGPCPPVPAKWYSSAYKTHPATLPDGRIRSCANTRPGGGPVSCAPTCPAWGSSSKRLHVEEAHQEEEEDLSQTYKAKFPILTHEEGAKFIIIKFREIIGCKYIPNSLLKDVGMLESFDQLLTQCGLKRFVSMYEDTNVELTTEFYTTLDVNAKNSQILEFRMQGKKYQLTYTFMNRNKFLKPTLSQQLI